VKRFLKLAIALLLAAACLRAEPIKSLHWSNYVNDFSGVLDAATAERLNELCKQVDEKAHAQIAVVTVKSTDGQDVFDYAVALYQAWGIGPKSSNRGVLILLATQDRKFGASTGYGLEPILPDGKVGGFRREAIPYLQQGNYNEGLSLMTSRISSVIAQDAGVTIEGIQTAAPVREYREPREVAPPNAIGIVVLLAILCIVVLVIWAVFKAGGGGSSRGGSGGGGFGNFLLGFVISQLLSGGRGGGGGGGWSGGGGFGGGGGGFGGFGGGSTGGGGSFGGY
jgi:uncharacterized protein